MTQSVQLHVVIPAHNEEALLPRALDAVHAAIDRANCRARVLVVADSCTDATAEAALAFGAEVLPVRFGRVGAARRAGFDHVLAATAETALAFGVDDPATAEAALAFGADDAATAGDLAAAGVGSTVPAAAPAPWIATTDADSAVPPHWCQRLLDFAAAGAEVVAGTVTLEPLSAAGSPTPLTEASSSAPLWAPHAEPNTLNESPEPLEPPKPLADPLGSRWTALYQGRIDRETHRHIHGANLALSARAYQRLGGFAPLAVHEDVDLIHRAQAADLRIHWPVDIPVMTSRRTLGRSPGGFSDDLKELIS